MDKKVPLTIDTFTAMTKALSDPHRVRAFCALRKGELCVCQIIELLGLAPSTISKHMSVLKQAGLVDSRKDGRWVHYRLAEERNGGLMKDIVTLAVSGLERDKQVRADDTCMVKITADGLDAVCKRQRNNHGD